MASNKTGMIRAVLCVYLILNVAYIIYCAAALISVEVSSNDASARVTMLDRAGLIDEANMRIAYPELADNMRYTLGRWIAENDHRVARNNANVGIFESVINILFVVFINYAVVPKNGSVERAA